MKLDYTVIENIIKEKRLGIREGSIFANKKKLLIDLGIDPGISKNSMDAVMKIVNKYFKINNISGSHRLIVKEVYQYIKYDVDNRNVREDIVTISMFYYLVSHFQSKIKSNKPQSNYVLISNGMLREIIGFPDIRLYANKESYSLDEDVDNAYIIENLSTYSFKKISGLLIKGNKLNIIDSSPCYCIVVNEDIKEKSADGAAKTAKKEVAMNAGAKRMATKKEEDKIKEATKLVKDRRNIKNINFSKSRDKIYEEIASIVGFESYKTNVFALTNEFLFNAENFIEEFRRQVMSKKELNTILLIDVRQYVVNRYDKAITKEIENKRLNAIDAKRLNAKKQKNYRSLDAYLQEMEDKGCDVSEPVYRHVYGITEDRDEMLRKIDDVLLAVHTVLD